MLAHPLFSGARRLSSLLRYLVEEMLAGRGDQLKEYTLGTAVLDRGSQFDPRLDSIVRVEASKLRARLAAYYQRAGANEAILIELPRGSYAPRIVARGGEVDTPRPTGAVAVLPFVHLGPEPDTEYLSDGLTEEIIDKLGMVPGLRVVARTSAFQFREKGGDIREIGRALGAGYLIEGSIRKSQNRFRVNARLIDATTGCRVWSHAYDEAPEDIFGLQTAIADAISAALRGQSSLSPEKGVAGGGLATDTYHLYLRGRFHRNQWTLEGFEKSVEYYERALSCEPESAQILAALSEAETLRAIVGHIPAAPHLDRARIAAERAIALDDRCAQAHLSLGWVRHIHDWDWESGQAEFDRALDVNPSFAEASHLKGLFLALRQQVAEAEECFKQAIESDPLSLVIQTHTALVPYFAGRFADAESRAQAALALDRNFAEAHWMLGWIYGRQERYGEALEKMQKAVELGGESPITLAEIALLHARLGNLQTAHDILARIGTGFPRPHPAAISLARVYLGLGDRAKSKAWLEEAFEARDVMLPWACADRKYEEIWAFPAFSGFRQRILGPTAR